MTLTCMPIDASAGAPAYTAQQARQAMSGMFANGTSRTLGSQSGFVAGRTPNVTASSTTWAVGVGAWVVDAAFTTTQAPYMIGNDAAVSGGMTAAHATLNRYDMIYLIVNDTAIDSSGSRNAQFIYNAGTGTSLASTPVVQTNPARSVKIADVYVPAVGGGSPSVTVNPQYVVAAGGLLPVASNTARAALVTSPYDGFPVYRQDLNIIQIWNGTTWDVYLPVSQQDQHIVSPTAIFGTNWDGTSQLIVQDFTVIAGITAANWSISYPTPFPNGLLSVDVNIGTGSSTYAQCYPSSVSSLSVVGGQVWDKFGAAPPTSSIRLVAHAVGW